MTNKERSKLYYANNRDVQAAKQKAYYEAHKAERKAYVEANKEKIRAQAALYRANNKERYRELHRKRYYSDLEATAKRNKEYREKNKERLEEKRVLRVYGITPIEWQALREQADGHCGICDKKPKKLFIDHNHGTGKIRGLLCRHCNTFIGHAFEDENILQLALAYLKRHNV